MHERAKALRLAGRQQAHGGDEVRLHDALGVALPGVGAVRREVEDPLRLQLADRADDRVAVEQIEVAHARVLAQLGESPGISTGVLPTLHLMACLEQGPHEICADESAGTGDERAHGQSPGLIAVRQRLPSGTRSSGRPRGPDSRRSSARLSVGGSGARCARYRTE